MLSQAIAIRNRIKYTPATSPNIGPMAGAPSTTVYVDNGRYRGNAGLPREFLDSREVTPDGTIWDINSFSGATASAKLTSVLNAIAAGTIMGGDVIELEAFSTGIFYQGAFQLPRRPLNGDGIVTSRTGLNLWILFRTKRYDELMPEGWRIQPLTTDNGKLARISANNASSLSAIQTSRSAAAGSGLGQYVSYYRFCGIEFVQGTGGNASQRIINLGDPGGLSYDIIEDIPRYLVLDRCYVHGYPSQTMKKALGLHCAYGMVVDSWIEDSGGDLESQAIEMLKGPGPYKIVNNTLVGGTETVMAGGDDAAIIDMRPSDIEFRRNDVCKWPWYNPADATYPGPAAARRRWIKNLFELKNAQFVLIEGNVFRNIWRWDQTGAAFLLKSVNQGGKSTGPGPTSKSTDIVARFNHIEWASNMFSMAGEPSKPVEEPLSRVFIEHFTSSNVGEAWSYPYDANLLTPLSSGAFLLSSGPIIDTEYRNITCLPKERTIMFTGSKANIRGGISDCVLSYGIANPKPGIDDDGEVPGEGDVEIAYFFPDGYFTNNIIVDVPESKIAGSYAGLATTNILLPSRSAVDFVSPLTGNFEVKGVYKGKGADHAAVAAYIDGVREPEIPSPTPTDYPHGGDW